MVNLVIPVICLFLSYGIYPSVLYYCYLYESVSSTSFLVTGERRPWLSHDLGNYFKFILK